MLFHINAPKSAVVCGSSPPNLHAHTHTLFILMDALTEQSSGSRPTTRLGKPSKSVFMLVCEHRKMRTDDFYLAFSIFYALDFMNNQMKFEFKIVEMR